MLRSSLPLPGNQRCQAHAKTPSQSSRSRAGGASGTYVQVVQCWNMTCACFFMPGDTIKGKHSSVFQEQSEQSERSPAFPRSWHIRGYAGLLRVLDGPPFLKKAKKKSFEPACRPCRHFDFMQYERSLCLYITYRNIDIVSN